MGVDYGRVINKNQLLGWRWAPLCDAVRRSPVLSDGAKILYNEIVSFIWQKEEIRAWPSQNTLGDNLSLSRQAIGRRSKELEAVGLIGVKRNGLGKTSDIYLYDLDIERLQVEIDDTGAFKPAPVEQVLSSSCPKSGTNEVNEDTPPESYPQVIHRQNDEVLSHETKLSPKVNGLEPVVTPDVTKPLHLDVTTELHQDVTQGLHQDVASPPGSTDVEGVSGLSVESVSTNGNFAEEETGNIRNREEEAGAPHLNSSTPAGKVKQIPEIIHREDIPKGTIPTWNVAMTEESVVIDGERFVLEAETSESELPDSKTVEAEMSDSEVDVNREKMAKLLSGIGNRQSPSDDDGENGVAPPRMSREEMRAKLLEMDRRDEMSQNAEVETNSE